MEHGSATPPTTNLNTLPELDTEDLASVVARWPRPSWATHSSLDDIRIDHERRGSSITLFNGDHVLAAVLCSSDILLTDGNQVAITRTEPRIDLTDSAIKPNDVLISEMSLDEARQLAHGILELVDLAEGRNTLAGAA